MTEEDDEPGKYELDEVRPFSWLTVGVIAVDCAEDVLGDLAGSLGKLRCHLINHIKWRESNESLLREIAKLPEYK